MHRHIMMRELARSRRWQRRRRGARARWRRKTLRGDDVRCNTMPGITMWAVSLALRALCAYFGAATGCVRRRARGCPVVERARRHASHLATWCAAMSSRSKCRDAEHEAALIVRFHVAVCLSGHGPQCEWERNTGQIITSTRAGAQDQQHGTAER